MYRRKKSTTQSCQGKQNLLIRTIFNLGLPRLTGSDLETSDTGAHRVAQGAASFAGHEALSSAPYLRTAPKGQERAKPRIMNTCANRDRNSRRISTSVLQDFKPCRINTYRKMGPEGPPLRTASSPRTSTNRMSFAALKKSSGVSRRSQSEGAFGAHTVEVRFVILHAGLVVLIRTFNSGLSTLNFHLTPAE
jgi:hypothetical protein